jgi:hypothetical protein
MIIKEVMAPKKATTAEQLSQPTATDHQLARRRRLLLVV